MHGLGTWIWLVKSFNEQAEDLALDPQCPEKGQARCLEVTGHPVQLCQPASAQGEDHPQRIKSPTTFPWLPQTHADARGG